MFKQKKLKIIRRSPINSTTNLGSGMKIYEYGKVFSFITRLKDSLISVNETSVVSPKTLQVQVNVNVNSNVLLSSEIVCPVTRIKTFVPINKMDETFKELNNIKEIMRKNSKTENIHIQELLGESNAKILDYATLMAYYGVDRIHPVYLEENSTPLNKISPVYLTNDKIAYIPVQESFNNENDFNKNGKKIRSLFFK